MQLQTIITICLFITVIHIVTSAIAVAITTPKCPDETTDQLYDSECFEFADLSQDDDIKVDYYAATDYCKSRNKTLANIHSTNQQKQIADRLKQLDWKGALIGFRRQNSGWKWADGSGLFLRGQGCYEAKDVDRSKLLSTQMSSMMTQQSCLQFCSKVGHQFAAVMASSFCYCTSNFIWTKPSLQCDLPCAGAPEQTCGSYTNSYVYYTPDFAFDNWLKARPFGVYDCGAIQVNADKNNAWLDSDCTTKRPFLCHFDNAIPRITNPTDKVCNNENNDSICYYLYANQELTWYEANLACTNLGGFLATVDTTERVEIVNKMIGRVVETKGINMGQIWIGANRFDWHFVDATVPSFRGWVSNEEPGSYECAEASALITGDDENADPSFGWRTTNCDDLSASKNRIICSTKSVLKEELSNKTDNNQVGPVVDQPQAVVATKNPSTDDKKFPWWGILIIVLAGFILIAVALGVIVVFLTKRLKGHGISPTPFNKKKERRREATKLDTTMTTGRTQIMLY